MTPLIGPVPPPGLHVMTFNVRRRMPLTRRRADRWRRRHPLLRTLLRTEQPALLAAQEVLPGQATAIGAALGARYHRIGYGRLPGPRDEGNPIFYDTERLELLSWAQRTLSDRPEEPGSMSWGNPIPRVFVQAAFRDRATAAEFVAIGTHFEVFSARARLKSAEAIRARVLAQPLPAIVMGDLNNRPDSTALRALLTGGTLVDGWLVAQERITPAWDTFGDYRPPKDNGRRIDHILTSPDIEVRRIGIHGEPIDGGWPSDHLPVQAVIRIPLRGTA